MSLQGCLPIKYCGAQQSFVAHGRYQIMYFALVCRWTIYQLFTGRGVSPLPKEPWEYLEPYFHGAREVLRMSKADFLN